VPRTVRLAPVPTITFHVTSTRNRESIAQHGLDCGRMLDQRGIAGSHEPEDACVFLSRDIEEAEWFVGLSRTHHKSVDIWEVTLPEDLDVWGDVRPPAPYGEIDGFLCTTEPIPADRVRLLRKDC
jgi:hypothetical protein